MHYARYSEKLKAVKMNIEGALRHKMSKPERSGGEAELRGSGLLGFRAMHQGLVNHHWLATTGEVGHALRIFYPQDVELQSLERLRRRVYRFKGPNYL